MLVPGERPAGPALSIGGTLIVLGKGRFRRPTMLRPDVRDWCEATLGGGCRLVWTEHAARPESPSGAGRGYRCWVVFENETDMVWFKLRWAVKSVP